MTPKKSTSNLNPPENVILSERNIINVSDECDANGKPLTYFITFDVINIEDKSVSEIAKDILNESKRDDFNWEVLVHEYLNESKVFDLLKYATKFLIKNPIEMVNDLVKLQ